MAEEGDISENDLERELDMDDGELATALDSILESEIVQNREPQFQIPWVERACLPEEPLLISI